MNSKEILRALQSGEIHPEEAEKELIKITNAGVVNVSSQLYSELPLSGAGTGNHARTESQTVAENHDKEKANEPGNQIVRSGPESLGNPLFRTRYRCKWNYYAGSMYRGVASEQLVIKMATSQVLSFFGSAGFSTKELECRIQGIQSQLTPDKPYGMCLLSDLDDSEKEQQYVELFLKYHVPVIEAAAFSSITRPLVYCRIKGLSRKNSGIVIPRRIIAKCSRLEVARMFLSPPPKDLVNDLLEDGMITQEEAEIASYIPMADDLAIEADSGGHTDQGVSFALIPSVVALKESMMRQYQYKDEILIGCGGGIGTPQAVAAAFMLGADFIFTGSINQCSVESGAHELVKDLLSTVTLHDTAMAPAGDMFEIGAKVQVVKKATRFAARANTLYQLFTQYDSIEEIPQSMKERIETQYFKKTFSEVWKLICEYKNQHNPEQIAEAQENPRVKMTLIFKWYFAHSSQATLNGEESEKDNFQIHCGPALGAFNQWVKGTPYEQWRNRHVDNIAELLLVNACEYIQEKEFFTESFPRRDSFVTLEESHKKKRFSTNNDESAIAIIGLSGKFPQSKTLRDFWENLADGRDCISEIPSSRWSLEQFYEPTPNVAGKSYSKWMGVLEDADRFDPLFFNISPAEAKFMDPQQRLFLEHCWRCIEDAGLDPSSLSGSRCGVFAGCGTGDYGKFMDIHELNAYGLAGDSISVLSARISYFLNLKGPCLSIDTACSSSLVAIAEACNSLLLHTTDLALAGGVNVLPGPSVHIMTSNAGMLSKDGRCFTFDERANGFVPGEGVGIILLKRLSDAVRDRDHIYGVIRGWGVNQDGKTNGLTAPSANSQKLLEQEVYERFGINPETITMVEAHGTGTTLGDPIEVEALTKAFESSSGKKNYCALGSVKSNIGHLLTAAGVAGVMKVVLALQHRMLPPTIHFETLNKHIFLEDSPFYVNTQLRPWNVDSGIPRRAAVSSFGFSGTNAHLVIEEYRPENEMTAPRIQSDADAPILFVLSAKNQEQLYRYTADMKRYLESHEDLNLADMAYTLQVGRKALNYRLACVANSRETLLLALKGVLNNTPSPAVFTAYVKKNVEGIAADEDGKALLQSLIQERKFGKIAELWVTGQEIDWNQLYGNTTPLRISLPTYPFDGERYWITGLEQTTPDVQSQKLHSAHKLHPLLHSNTSDLSAQRFSSMFTGQEFFLTEHIVNGQRVLPEAAHLEMARAAVTLAASASKRGQDGIRLTNVVWGLPVVVEEQGRHIHIRLFPGENNQIVFEIYSDSETEETAPVIHCQGWAALSSVTDTPHVDLPTLQTQCAQSCHSPKRYYEAFREMGLGYGPGFQGIKTVHIGLGQRLAKLSLPSSSFETQNHYVLHPGIIDSAVQAAVAFMDGPDAPHIAFPFALNMRELVVFERCVPTMWAHIRDSDAGETEDRVRGFDIDLCDDAGAVCVRIKGLAYQECSQTASTQHEPRADVSAEITFPDLFDKPDGILLRPLSEDFSLSCDPADVYAQAPISLPPTDSLCLQPESHESSQAELCSHNGVSAEILEEELIKSLAEALCIQRKELDADGKFVELGLDSVIGVEWIKALNKLYGTSFSASTVYRYPSIRDLAGFLEKELKKQSNQETPPSPKQNVNRRSLEFSPQRLSPITVASRFNEPQKERFGGSQKQTNVFDLALEYGKTSIAIIGLSGQFPKAKTLPAFWDNLAHGRDCISEVPASRWSLGQFYDSDPQVVGKTYSKWMGLLDDVELFDSKFFNISPREAELMDPQQRLFLENCWRCIEDAGLRPSSLAGSSCGVFVGCGTSDYGDSIGNQGLNAHGLMGKASSILSARISYVLDLKGPCLAIDTACSSSLVAISEACNSLLLQTSDLALAGGVCVLAGPSMHIMTSKAGMLSKDGRCFTFDSRANGFVPGEGVGVLLLKRLSDAVRDRDHIHGVIRGWGINQDGKTNGITAPNVDSQKQLEQEVYQRFGIDPETISMVEAHGTGTKLGDPIEVEALTEAFRSYTDKKQYCALGSVKSNIGHLLTAAGVAGVTKVLLALQHQALPPAAGFATLNEHISLEDSPFYINTELQPWNAASGAPRRAAVSSFGFSGTNAHLVLEEYLPSRNTASTPVLTGQRNSSLVILSAKSQEQLRSYASALKNHIESHEELSLTDMAYTLQVGREALEYRLAFLADSREELLISLGRFLEDISATCVLTAHVEKNSDGVKVFETDEDAKALLQTWVQKKKLRNVAELWVKGVNIDWSRFYGDMPPRRISLPTCPFVGERYWLANADVVSENIADHITIPSLNCDSSLCLERSDEPQSQPSISAESLRKELTKSLSEALCTTPGDVNADKQFVELGLDSIIGLEWIQAINKQYGTSFQATTLYEYPNIREFAEFLEQQLGTQQRGDKQANFIRSQDLSSVPEKSDNSQSQPGISTESLRKELTRSLAEALYMSPDDVNVDKQFVELGLDSIIGLEWVQAINKHYGTSFQATMLYEYPNIREFAEFLEQQLGTQQGVSEQVCFTGAPDLSLDDLIQQVQQGTLDCKQAGELFHQFD